MGKRCLESAREEPPLKARTRRLRRLGWLRAQRTGIVVRRRLATTSGAVLLGLVALLFARNADNAQSFFLAWLERAPLAAFLVTPAAFALIVYITRRFSPEARGSGIPQVIAGAHKPDSQSLAPLTSLRTVAFKYVLTLGVLAVGGSAGREGPTVQLSAAIMKAVHRLFGIELTSAVVIAGGAAGVSAAFNTPLAGVAFAIEELASAYEQRLAVLVMGAVMISGLVSLGLAGDYLYFGAMHEVVSLQAALVICPMAGVVGGRRRRPVLARDPGLQFNTARPGRLAPHTSHRLGGRLRPRGRARRRVELRRHLGRRLLRRANLGGRRGAAALVRSRQDLRHLDDDAQRRAGRRLRAFPFGRRRNRSDAGATVPLPTQRRGRSARHDRLFRRRRAFAR